MQKTGRILIHSLFRKKTMILALNAGFLGAILFGTLLWPPSYEADSTLIIRGRNYEAPLFPQSRPEGPWTVLMNPKDEINSEIEIIRSRPVLERTVADLKLYERRIPSDGGLLGFIRTPLWALVIWLEDLSQLLTPGSGDRKQTDLERAVIRLGKKLRVEPAIESQVVRIGYRSGDPVLASEVVNKVVQEYLRQHLAINLNHAESGFYAEQIKEMEAQLKVLQGQLVTLKSQTGLLSFDEQSKALLHKLNTFDVARTTANKEAISKRSKVEKVSEIRERYPDLLIPLPELAQDIQIQDLENKLINLRYDLGRVRERYTDSSIQVQTILKEIKDLERQIDAHVRELLERDMAELSKLEAEEQALAKTIDQLKVQIAVLPAHEVELRNLERELEDKENVLSVLRKKYLDSLVAQATDYRLENAKVVSLASVPLKPAYPILWLNLLVGVILSLAVSFSLAFFLTYMDDTLSVPEDVERVLGLQTIASVPEL